MESLFNLSPHEWVRLIHLLLLLGVLLLFRKVFKRPILRLFDWKYFTSGKEKKKN